MTTKALRRLVGATALMVVLGLGQAQAAQKANIGVSVPDAAFLPVYVAQEKGFYAQEGLESQLVQFDNDGASRMALLSNAIQLNCAAIFPVIDAYLNGSDMVAIWSEYNGPTYVWYGPAKYSSLKDLKGGRVGVSSIGAMSHRLSAWALSKDGINPEKDVSFVALGGPLNRVAALKVGQVDLIPASPPGTYQLQAEGFKPLLKLADLMPEFSTEIFSARRSNLAKDDAVLKGIIHGTIRAKHWSMAHRDEATTILMKYLGGKDEERPIYVKTMDETLPNIPDDGHHAVESIDVFLQFYKEQGKFKDGQKPALSAFTDDRFIEYFKAHPITD